MKFEMYRGDDGDWWWRCRERNGKITADSSEGYRRPGQCDKAIKKHQAKCAEAKIVKLEDKQ